MGISPISVTRCGLPSTPAMISSVLRTLSHELDVRFASLGLSDGSEGEGGAEGGEAAARSA
eukprot:910042-Pleurochrysis_carterae.AAC.1